MVPKRKGQYGDFYGFEDFRGTNFMERFDWIILARKLHFMTALV